MRKTFCSIFFADSKSHSDKNEEKIKMHVLTELIKSDMKPALGVTEPGAIAFAVSTAKAHMKGDVKKVNLRLNSGMYKNAFTCGIPGTSEVGNYYAAALGAIAADPKKGLECLEGIARRGRGCRKNDRGRNDHRVP